VAEQVAEKLLKRRPVIARRNCQAFPEWYSCRRFLRGLPHSSDCHQRPISFGMSSCSPWADRLDTLRSYEILDTLAEPRFDRLTRMAITIFSVPISLISLLDSDRQWFKSHPGLDACETPLDVSFCKHAVEHDEVMVVLDATRDERFANNSLVTGPPSIRFYAGAPLKASNGAKIGTLCIIDRVPRGGFSGQDRLLLTDLAAIVADEMELRKALLQRNQDRMLLARGS
jgi:GAF domain-containing protein